MSNHPDLPILLTGMQAFIQQKIVQGFDAADDIAREAADNFVYELETESQIKKQDVTEADRTKLREAAALYTQQAVSAQLRAQEGWPARTDNNRLDEVFDKLESLGIIARQNFTCCDNCAGNALPEALHQFLQDHEESDIDVQGYAYYHMQDTEQAADGKGLLLSFGDVDDDEKEIVRIGHEIVKVLKEFGFEPQWNGSPKMRIELPFQWQRRFRLAGSGPAMAGSCGR